MPALKALAQSRSRELLTTLRGIRRNWSGMDRDMALYLKPGSDSNRLVGNDEDHVEAKQITAWKPYIVDPKSPDQK